VGEKIKEPVLKFPHMRGEEEEPGWGGTSFSRGAIAQAKSRSVGHQAAIAEKRSAQEKEGRANSWRRSTGKGERGFVRSSKGTLVKTQKAQQRKRGAKGKEKCVRTYAVVKK